MTKEELKQEAEEKCVCTDEAMRIMYGIGYIDGAEPREKQIEIDAEQIRALQKQNGELTDKVRELEAQIEKMKCCGNCKYSAQETVYSIVCKVGGVNKGEIENVEDCLVCNQWEIKEK